MTTKYLGDGIWVRRTNIDSADIMLPIERQGVHAEPIQGHNAVSIATGATSYTSWLEVDGFDKIGINVTMTSGEGMYVELQTSFDGVNYFSGETVHNGSGMTISKEMPVTSPFVRLAVKNTATTSKTTSSWLYLKA